MSCPDQTSGGRENDRPTLDVACLNLQWQRAALVSTTGNHCEVWRSARKNAETDTDAEEDPMYTEFVIKYPFERYSDREASLLARQYRLLRVALGEIVPEALFVVSCINGQPSLVVLARAVNVWFNIANPQNREEAIGLLRKYPIARAQLNTFVRQARAWRQGANPRVIDLYGLDNLIMDNRQQIRYVDSFYVFFFEDLLHILGGERDYDLEEKIGVSLRRLEYLEEILRAAEAGADR